MPGRGKYWIQGGLPDNTVVSADIVDATIVAADVSASAAIAVTQLASGTADQVVKTNTGGTALEHGLLADANIDAAAAIAVTKVANGAANEVVKTDSGGTTLESGLLADANLTSGVYANITGVGAQSQTLDLNAQKIDNVANIAVGEIRDETDTVDSITITDTTGAIAINQDVTLDDTVNISTNTGTGSQIGTATTQKIGFYGVTPVVQQTALTAPETTVTFVDENTPDFALSSLTTSTPAGFATLDEAQAFVEVVVNNQARLNEVETKLQALGLLA